MQSTNEAETIQLSDDQEVFYSIGSLTTSAEYSATCEYTKRTRRKCGKRAKRWYKNMASGVTWSVCVLHSKNLERSTIFAWGVLVKVMWSDA